MKKSVWQEFEKEGGTAELQEDIDCEVLVVGGGMAGILTAYFLQLDGKNVVVAEAKEIGGGITQNTTAVITAQHDTAYSELIRMHGIKKTRDYLNANLDAVKSYRALCDGIDCDFENKPSYMYSVDRDMSGERNALQRMGYKAELVRECGLPFKINGAVKFPDMAQFHPLKFLYALAKNLTVYENTFIEKIEGHTAYTDKYRIHFKQAVIASHFPFMNRTGWFFIKMFQERSYVLALGNAGDVGGTMIADTTDGFYFRNYGDLLLVGKGDDRTGTETNAIEQLHAFKQKYYPNADIKYLWANQDCVTLDHVPYVGKYGYLKDVYTLTGFNLWGMTGSMVGAKILTDLLCGRRNAYAHVFRTRRRFIRAQLFKNLGVVLLNWVKPTIRRCPHLGCALTYNKREHCWDCQCHGSRFDSRGGLIDNPAMKDAETVKHSKYADTEKY